MKLHANAALSRNGRLRMAAMVVEGGRSLTEAVTGALLMHGRAATIQPAAAHVARLLEHGSPTMPQEILIDAGQRIVTGSDLVDDTVAGWTATVIGANGSLGLRGTRRGVSGAVFAELAPDALLRNNPRLLLGQQVRHPAPPASAEAAGWVVEAVDQPSSLLVLTRGQARSSVPINDVVRHNLDELRARLQVLPGS